MLLNFGYNVVRMLEMEDLTFGDFSDHVMGGGGGGAHSSQLSSSQITLYIVKYFKAPCIVCVSIQQCVFIFVTTLSGLLLSGLHSVKGFGSIMRIMSKNWGLLFNIKCQARRIFAL